MTETEIINGLLQREGSEYTNRAADRGGPTKYGITLKTLSAYRGRPCSAADVRALTESEARDIYRKLYIVDPGYLLINDPCVRAFTIDSAVQHGEENATKFLQRAAHVFPDGQLGKVTAEAVNRVTPRALFVNMFAERLAFYGGIISRDDEAQRAKAAGFVKLQAFNAKGWANRMGELLKGMLPK